jgi:hypothetical protein
MSCGIFLDQSGFGCLPDMERHPPDGPAVGFCPVSGSALIPECYLGTPTNERTLKRTNTMRFLTSGLLLMELRLSIRGPTTGRNPSF